jgi:hypothetical protein
VPPGRPPGERDGTLDELDGTLGAVTEEAPGGVQPEGRRPWPRITGGARLPSVLFVLLIVGVGAALVLWKADQRLSRGSGAAGPPGQVGVPWERALLSVDGERVAVRFEGVPLGGDQPCGAWYIGLSAALRHALRVTVITLPGPDVTDGGTCPADRSARCVEVRLPYPPGDLPILDTMTGEAPPMDRAPASLGPAGAGVGDTGETDTPGKTGAPGDLCAELTGG